MAPAASAISAAGKLLRKLDPVAVRIEDVEQAHRPVELEDDPDLDARAPEPLGLRLDVFDVHVRDAAVLRLSLGEPDLHSAPLQPGPAALAVEVGLCEAERVSVERASPLEVAD